MVICVFALRLNVVASLKVMPSAEFAPVCTTSIQIKDVVVDADGVASLLRTTLDIPGQGCDVADRLLDRLLRASGRLRATGAGAACASAARLRA